MEQISPNVYISTCPPGINVGFVLTGRGVVVVDVPPAPAEARAWQEQIRQVTDSPIRFTILTSHRPERAYSARLLGAPVIALRSTPGTPPQAGGETAWVESDEETLPPEEMAPPEPVPPSPALFLTERLTLHDRPTLIVEAVTGARPDSLWVLLPEEKVLFAGDSVVVGCHPLLGSAPDTKGWLETLVRVRRSYFPAQTIIPGRGPVASKEDTLPLSEYIQKVRRRVRAFRASGHSPADLAGLAQEFLPLFPFEPAQQEVILRRIRSGLERVYEEMG
jgi:glyoxylase-like metal-dependent hydrolase (beta-lactamase superfamily II)